MAFDPITAITGLADTVIKRIWPDPTEAEKAKLAMFQAEMDAESKALAGQLAINQAEASHASLLVAGWRPAVGWTCAISLSLIYIPKALVLTVLWTYQACVFIAAWNGQGAPTLPMFPDLGLTDVLGLLGGMLGIGGMRTVEKLKGVAR